MGRELSCRLPAPKGERKPQNHKPMLKNALKFLPVAVLYNASANRRLQMLIDWDPGAGCMEDFLLGSRQKDAPTAYYVAAGCPAQNDTGRP